MRETGNTSSTVDSWAARLLAEALSSPGGSYTGRASKHGRAIGYAPQVPHRYKPDDGILAEADDFSANGVATQFTTQDSGTAAAIAAGWTATHDGDSLSPLARVGIAAAVFAASLYGLATMFRRKAGVPVKLR